MEWVVSGFIAISIMFTIILVLWGIVWISSTHTSNTEDFIGIFFCLLITVMLVAGILVALTQGIHGSLYGSGA